jgi:hypothetical protein
MSRENSRRAADFENGLSFGKARRFRVIRLNDDHPAVEFADSTRAIAVLGACLPVEREDAGRG